MEIKIELTEAEASELLWVLRRIDWRDFPERDHHAGKHFGLARDKLRAALARAGIKPM
jgi:hypothetical protein